MPARVRERRLRATHWVRRSTVVGEDCRFLQGAETDSEAVGALRDGIDAAEPVSVELLNYRGDGSTFWNHVTVALVEDDDGEVSHFVGFQQDVTDRVGQARELERQLDLFEKAQDLAVVGAWEYDVRTESGFWTHGVRSIYGFGADVDLTVEESVARFHPDDEPVIAAAFERADARGEGYDLELRLRDGDDEGSRCVRMRAETQYAAGDLVRVRGTMQDVTDRHEYAETLDTLHERTREMTRAADQSTVVEVALAAMDEIRGFDGAVVYEFGGGDVLVPVSWSDGVRSSSLPGPENVNDGVLWEAFVDGSVRVVEIA